MKKLSIPTILFMSFMLLAGIMPAYSTLYTVQVGNYFFNPQNLSGVNAGDTIRWEWAAGNHTTTSTTIPAGAATWDEPITAGNPTYDYIPTVGGTYNYKCTPHAGMGMVGSFTVTSAVPLTVSASATPNNLCMGASTIVACFPEGGTGSYTYSWVSSPPGFTSNQQSFTVIPMQNTTYAVTVTSGPQTASASASVTVQQACMMTAMGDTSYCSDVTSFPVSATGSNYSSVNWTTSGDGTFENGNTLNAIYSPGPNDIAAGMVDLMVHGTPMAPCMMPATDQVSVVLESCTGIGNKTANSIDLAVYPNPSTGQFTVLTGKLNGKATLRIFDMQGRIVFTESIEPGGTQGTAEAVNISGLASGIYQLRLISDKSTGSARILIK